MKVFIDTNILLDVLARREPFFADAARIWTMAEQGSLQAYVSAFSFNNIYYVVRKAQGRAAADKALRLYLREQIEALLADYGFREALSGNLRSDATSQARLPTILFRLHCIHSKDEEQALLRTVLDHVIDAREFPQVQQFRLAHEHRPSLPGDLIDRGLLAMNRGRYTLTIMGLRGCLPGQARDEIKRCNGIIDELKAMYRSDPERLWSTRKLAAKSSLSFADTARAVTFLSESPIFYGLNWNGSTGFVESFSLGQQVLNAELLTLQYEIEE